MRSLEAVLVDLVNRVSPGEVKLSIPRFAVLRDETHFEVSVQTRGYDECFLGKTINEAAYFAQNDQPFRGIVIRWNGPS